MKKVGFVLLGVGCGILLYLLYSYFFADRQVISPVDQPVINNVIRQGVKDK